MKRLLVLAFALAACSEPKPLSISAIWEGTTATTATRPAKFVSILIIGEASGVFSVGPDADTIDWASLTMAVTETEGSVSISIYNVDPGNQTWVYSGSLSNDRRSITGSFTLGPLTGAAVKLFRK